MEGLEFTWDTVTFYNSKPICYEYDIRQKTRFAPYYRVLLLLRPHRDGTSLDQLTLSLWQLLGLRGRHTRA